ncbi:MAG TPA: hypothetical protein VJ867_01765 [Gemmatimonadaceae bacterium]|nr:hypothetical protein [Gemmatimonadaceae bacterium]
MIITRRRFVSQSLASLAATALATRWAPPGAELRVATRVDATQPDIADGLAFGAAEADRSAQLFGWRVRRIDLSDSASTSRNDYDALVVGTPVHIATYDVHVPVLALSCASDGSANVFQLNSCSPPAATDAGARVVLWHASLERFGAEQLNDRYRAAIGRAMTGDAWLAWFGMKVLAESALRARSSDRTKLLDYLRSPSAQFDGHKGVPLHFDAQRRLVQPLYVVRGAADARVIREIDP